MNCMFCDSSELSNEASVEAEFLYPLIRELGYSGNETAYKESISALPVGKGRQKVLYKPDVVLKANNIPYIVIDAKAATENVYDWTLQCSSYCLEINKLYDYNPVQYYAITNGLKFVLFQWDRKNAALELEFQDFAPGNEKFEKLKAMVSWEKASTDSREMLEAIGSEDFPFSPVSMDRLSNIFTSLHTMVWKAEKKNPSAAFSELIKIVFIKIDRDRKIHGKYGKAPKPKYRDMVFSSHWFMNQTENNNPVNDPLFKNLKQDLEKDIVHKNKKRIFGENDKINLSPETTLKIVKELEHIDMYAMDEDVHGRLFESFLDATARGRDIGQYFTPREIVDLMVGLAGISITRSYVPKILDACCGSGGFLIASMAAMMRGLENLPGLTNIDKKDIEKKIKEESIFGIDAGSEPAMYRIARMNMYLHGDGGSRIYCADSLDKNVGKVGPDDIENDEQLEELRTYLLGHSRSGGTRFDVILSNPPFSLQYERKDTEQSRILNQYELAVNPDNGKICNSLPSSVMFIERYKELVSEDGQILAVIDDSILSGESYGSVREYIRRNFIVKAVVSLPADAFKRSMARVNTSVIILRLRKPAETQPEVFMYPVKYIGLESKVAKRIGIDCRELNDLKEKERETVISAYHDFLDGRNTQYAVPPARISDRMDVKFCINDRGRLKNRWLNKGYSITTFKEELTQQANRAVAVSESEIYQLLKVTYEGDVCEGELKYGDDSSYKKLYQVKEWDILISNMGVGRGAAGLVPPFHAGKYVSNEYTILRARSKEAAVFYTEMLRSKEIQADILASATGMNRGRIKWNEICGINIPKCNSADPALAQLLNETVSYWESAGKYLEKKQAHREALGKMYDVDGTEAQERWLGFKPPE